MNTRGPRVVRNPFDEPVQGGNLSRHPRLFVALVILALLVAALSCVASGVW
jgi:hypothetical protein